MPSMPVALLLTLSIHPPPLVAGVDAKAREYAVERKHMHIDDIEGVFRSHGWGVGLEGGAGTKVVFFHVSAKHGPSLAVWKQLKGALPEWMIGRCGIINNDWWRGDERDASVYWY